MPASIQRVVADVAPQSDNPLNFALTARDQKTIDMVATAVKNKQVLLAYQPIMQARDQNKVAFYEGLIRVLDETGRIIPAGAFMDAIENIELGRQLDTLALDEGLRALHENPELRLSINMSARSIGYAPWNRMLDEWLTRNELIGERLILEITESSALVAPELVVDFMDRLQLRGICFAMDDFGAGYTALRYFKEFCFDVIKIDGQFIKGIADDPDNQAMTAALVSIAKHFDMLTVAEFVECEADAQKLVSLGVDCLQGYHFAAATTRPAWLRDTHLSQAV
ncbi:EAL domain-containing protein [Roseobacter denitrificans]|nr:EAL domain-containing protein [Roseobacter denitrificans]AVL54813.1 EAL domain-containing protein [Roseobacter denitrificans]SFG45325.1 EAL domain, c-di-GMP-specific phosphodiesterase class I (or its enzymatically inactive variant) [Roseobacter denitrificans OCh 114]